MKQKQPSLFNPEDIAKLRAIIDGLDAKGRTALLNAVSGEVTAAKKASALAQIRSIVQVTDEQIRSWLTGTVSKAYTVGINSANTSLNKAGVKTGYKQITFDEIQRKPDLSQHLAAVNILLSDSYLDFASTMNGYVKGSEKILNEAIRQQIQSQISDGVLEGKSIQNIRKNIKDTIAAQGFTVLTDKGGRNWNLTDYSTMLARTHVVKASNEAIANRSRDFNMDIVEITKTGTTDSICLEYDGGIFSLSGNSETYPYLDQQPPFHPNCKHILLLRPDLSLDEK